MTFVPNVYMIGDYDATWIVGIGTFALIGAALAVAIELIPDGIDRLMSRKK